MCGWRPQWTSDPERLAARIHDVAESSTKGSYICFLNQMPTSGPGSFSEQMESIGRPLGHDESVLRHWTKGWTVPGYPDFHVYHREGNAAREEHLVDVLKDSNALEVAIVLGTQNGIVLPPTSMDTRVLSILLLLKHLTKKWPKKLHVISENQIDQTADVAVTPGGSVNEPDFVNTLAFTARSLVMALTYPSMQPALNEMFEDEDISDGSPEFDIIPCSFLGLANRRLPFGVIQQIVNGALKKRKMNLTIGMRLPLTLPRGSCLSVRTSQPSSTVGQWGSDSLLKQGN